MSETYHGRSISYWVQRYVEADEVSVQRATEILMEIGGRARAEAVPVALEMLYDADRHDEYRFEAATLLGIVGAVGELADALRADDPVVREAARVSLPWACIANAREVAQVLGDKLREGTLDPERREEALWAIRFLTEQTRGSTIQALEGVLDDPEADKTAVAWFLGGIASVQRNAVYRLVDTLNGGDDSLRDQAASALASILSGAIPILKALQNLADDPGNSAIEQAKGVLRECQQVLGIDHPAPEPGERPER